MNMNKMTPHIIAVTALVVFIALGLACATPPIGEMKSYWISPEWNWFNLELKMADGNVPQREQSFLYCESYGVKDKILMTYTKPKSVVVLPAQEKKHIWVRLETPSDKHEWSWDLDLEPGQSYWITDPLWEERHYRQALAIVIPLTEEGIEMYTEKMWGRSNGNLYPYGKKDDWVSYEEYHEFITQVWQVRKQQTNRQLQ